MRLFTPYPAARRPCLCDDVGAGFKPAPMGTGRGTPVKRNNPIISIFISVDPLLEKYPNISPYAYCLNNPVKYIDPDGKKVIATSEVKQIVYAAWTKTLNKYRAKEIAMPEKSDVKFYFLMTDDPIDTDIKFISIDKKGNFIEGFRKATGILEPRGDGTKRALDINVWKEANFEQVLEEFMHGYYANEYLQKYKTKNAKNWKEYYNDNICKEEQKAKFKATGVEPTCKELEQDGYKIE